MKPSQFFKQRTVRSVTTILVGIIVVAVFLGGTFTAGYELGRSRPKNIIVKGITNVGDKDATANFGLFWEVWDKLKSEHLYGAEAEDQTLVYGAINGLVDSLDDPNTIFLKPEVSKKFEEDIRGQFGGIGAEIGVRDGNIVVIAPLPDSPAERAGLKARDVILKINDNDTGGVDVNEAVIQIRGEIGTKVTLTIGREGLSEPRTFTITRDVIRVPTVKTTFIEGSIAHIQLYNFNENAPGAFYEAIMKAASEGTNGIILDLRNNPGGFLEVAVNIAGWFIPQGELVATEELRSGDKREFRTTGNGSLKDIPIVILVNGGSASASEILAGALRDHRDVPIIGEQTFGKGTVQELQTLSDGNSKLKITIAHWRLPDGELIEKTGITPTIEVKFTEEDAEAGEDPQLDKAVEVVKTEIQKYLATQ